MRQQGMNKYMGSRRVACSYILLDDDHSERRDMPGVCTSDNSRDFETTREKHAYVAQNGVHIEGIYC
jgi:hypothetical protein